MQKTRQNAGGWGRGGGGGVCMVWGWGWGWGDIIESTINNSHTTRNKADGTLFVEIIQVCYVYFYYNLIYANYMQKPRLKARLGTKGLIKLHASITLINTICAYMYSLTS